MRGWKTLPMQLKLPLAFAAVAILTAITMTTGSSFIARDSQIVMAKENFTAVGKQRHDLLHSWLASVEASVVTASTGPQAIDGLYRLSSAFKDLGADAQSILQKAYIADNPNPLGKRQLLDRAKGDAYYHSQHSTFNKAFRTIVEQQGFYDLFLIDRAGNVVYTVFKEADFGANLINGPLADTGLAKVFRESQNAKAGEIFFSDFEPYAPSAGASAMFVAAPIMNELGYVVGTLAVQLSTDAIANILSPDQLVGASSDIYLISPTLHAMTDSRFASAFKSGEIVKETPYIMDSAAGGEAFYDDVVLQSGQRGFAQTLQIENSSSSWILVMERDYSDLLGPFYTQLKLEIVLGLASIATCLVLGIWLSRTFVKPISRLNDAIRIVAGGDYETTVTDLGRSDELGTIAASLEDLRATLSLAHGAEIERESKRSEQTHVVQCLMAALRNLAAGDLTQPIIEELSPDYEILRTYFNDAITKMDEAVSKIATTTEGIRAQSGEITRASEELAHRTEVQAATLEQTAAAMDEMTASVKSAAKGVQEVEVIVRDARKDADQSGVVVKEAVSAMAEIEKSSDQISQIIGVIDDIAFQTNLLALNAGVEAARAGDAGRGFAVVASEVGALAQRASTAAKEIKNLISASSQHVERGVECVKQAGEALQQIAQRVTHISALTSNMATGASEQSIGLNEINVGVTQLDQATQKNAAMAEEATAASHMLQTGALELGELISRFKLSGHQMFVPNLINMPVSETEMQFEPAPAIVDHAAMPMAAAGGRGVWQDF